MAKADLPAPELLRQLLDYNPETGALYWKMREPHHFKNGHFIHSWNNRNAGKRADSIVSPSTRSHKWRQDLLYDRKFLAHRLAWAIQYGEWPKDQIDHINGDPTDNRITNLRDVSDAENKRNKAMTNRNNSGVLGVFFTNEQGRSKPWIARIRADGKDVHLGAFKTLEEAAQARREAEARYGYHENHGRRQAITSQTN